MKRVTLALSIAMICLNARSQTDTVKCYVQITIPFKSFPMWRREFDDTELYNNGGMIIYTKAYAIRENGRYVKFLSVKRKEIKEIWKPDDNPQVMVKEW